eukprot:6019702-Prymnesium_polylepis.2
MAECFGKPALGGFSNDLRPEACLDLLRSRPSAAPRSEAADATPSEKVYGVPRAAHPLAQSSRGACLARMAPARNE